MELYQVVDLGIDNSLTISLKKNSGKMYRHQRIKECIVVRKPWILDRKRRPQPGSLVSAAPEPLKVVKTLTICFTVTNQV